MSILVLLVSLNISFQIKSTADELQHYEFFHFMESHTDKAQQRLTGCVTADSNCYSEGPDVVADCKKAGSNVWLLQ